MNKRCCLTLACLLVLTALPTAAADRGMVAPGDVSVYEPGQKAIIAWDGKREVLILSTDVRASENSWVLELLPLPSQPKVEAGDSKSFHKIQQLLWKHAVDVWTARGEILGEAPLKVIFHENIGAHSITVVRATNAQELIGFAKNLWVSQGLTQELSWGKLENLAAAYIGRGMSYWVIDLIDLSDFWKSIQPIVCTFETDCLYFPLEISSLASGETEITLFTLTDNKLNASSVKAAGFSIASFQAGEENVLLEFEVSQEELRQVSPKVAELFENKVWLTALTYSGPLENLEGDIMFSAAPAGGAERPTGMADQLLAAAWAALIVVLILGIFTIVYKLSPYYRTSPPG